MAQSPFVRLGPLGGTVSLTSLSRRSGCTPSDYGRPTYVQTSCSVGKFAYGNITSVVLHSQIRKALHPTHDIFQGQPENTPCRRETGWAGRHWHNGAAASAGTR